jgi:hypothetical protein
MDLKLIVVPKDPWSMSSTVINGVVTSAMEPRSCDSEGGNAMTALKSEAWS